MPICRSRFKSTVRCQRPSHGHYTSGTTLLPLLALIFFGGSTLFWFAIALALGVVVEAGPACPGSFFVELVALTFQCAASAWSPPLQQDCVPAVDSLLLLIWLWSISEQNCVCWLTNSPSPH